MYLVTGGAGFIGSNLVNELLKRGESVRVIDNFSTGKRANLEEVKEKIEIFEGSLCDLDLVERVCAGVDYVLHQAALPSVPRSVKDPLTSTAVNVGGTLNVPEAARQAGMDRAYLHRLMKKHGSGEC